MVLLWKDSDGNILCKRRETYKRIPERLLIRVHGVQPEHADDARLGRALPHLPGLALGRGPVARCDLEANDGGAGPGRPARNSDDKVVRQEDDGKENRRVVGCAEFGLESYRHLGRLDQAGSGGRC